MKIITAPESFDDVKWPSVFLAGGITNCPDWQSTVIESLSGLDFGYILNPRRENFPIHDPSASRKQIEWEFYAIGKASLFAMWFCNAPSDQPICMYELGSVLQRHHREYSIIVGVEPGYRRTQDVMIQTSLVSKRIAAEITHSLTDHILKIAERMDFMNRNGTYPGTF